MPASTRAIALSLLLLAAPASGWDEDHTFRDGSSPEVLAEAEAQAGPAGAKVLAQARVMTVEKKEILPGACWDYVNTVYKRAGYPAAKRKTAFKGTKKGPYAKASEIQGGDWLYFINHSYNNIEHSSLFVAWADKAAMQGWLLSYAGEKRAEPARYKLYHLDNVYRVIRPKD